MQRWSECIGLGISATYWLYVHNVLDISSFHRKVKWCSREGTSVCDFYPGEYPVGGLLWFDLSCFTAVADGLVFGCRITQRSGGWDVPGLYGICVKTAFLILGFVKFLPACSR